jgi:hypothetical protein
LGRRALAILAIGVFYAIANRPAPAQEPAACKRDDQICWQELQASECSRAASTIESCLVFLQRLETARRRSSSSAMALLLGDTLRGLARRDLPPQVQARYLERSRAAYREVVKNEPLNASGYLGLADVAEPGEERVRWLRGAVQAEFQPAHMELLAGALAGEIGGHAGNLEAARVLEDAYTHESTDTEKWRYAAGAFRTYTYALDRYPSATSGRSVDNVLIRIEDDIDHALLRRMLLDPESHLAYLDDAFATLCEKSIAAIVSLDDCMAGLELAVTTAEGSLSPGARRLLAEATLTGMRTIAGESLPRSAEAQRKFLAWIDRLLLARLEPVEVSANLLEAQADYTAILPARADALRAAIALVPNRGDLRLKLGATYVSLWSWQEALEQLRVARFYLPPEEHEGVDELVETADEAYQASFFPPAAAATE